MNNNFSERLDQVDNQIRVHVQKIHHLLWELQRIKDAWIKDLDKDRNTNLVDMELIEDTPLFNKEKSNVDVSNEQNG